MAASATRHCADSLGPAPRVGVAFSGGRDSTALLHATLRAANPLGIEVVALHVNHRLNADADRWQQRAAATCRRWARAGSAIAWRATRLSGRPPAGESVEAWARDARYAALGHMAREEGAGLVLLAHHRRDQAETFLLQALRGCGVSGLSAMPQQVDRAGIVWARPWLHVDRSDIDDYLRRQRLRYVDDNSNSDACFARNRLRLTVVPALEAAFPAAQVVLARAAGHAAEAAAALGELAAIDLASTAVGDALAIGPWQALSPARRSNLLRAWLQTTLGRPAAGSLVRRLLGEWVDARGYRCWPCEQGRLVAWRGLLRFESAPAASKDPREVPECSLPVVRPGCYRVDSWRGSLEVSAVPAGGLPWGRLADLRLVARRGGERFQAGAGQPPRSLKKQFQALRVTPDERSVPLGYSGADLLYVPGLGVDARVRAGSGEPQAALCWRPDPPPSRHAVDS